MNLFEFSGFYGIVSKCNMFEFYFKILLNIGRLAVVLFTGHPMYCYI